MPFEQAKATLGRKTRLKAMPPELRKPSEKFVEDLKGIDLARARTRSQRASPAKRYSFRTTVGELKATCLLFFLDDALGAIRCTTNPIKKSRVHAKRVEELRTSLERQYGPRHAEHRPALAESKWVSIWWRDDEVKLILEMTHPEKRTGPFEITLENHTHAFAKAIRAVDAEARRALEAELKLVRDAKGKAQAAREEAERVKQERLRRDLSSAPEGAP